MARLTQTFAALDPFDLTGNNPRLIGLEQQQLDSLLRGGHTTRLARLKLASEVASDPYVVFEDWKRPQQEDGLCYCGRPTIDYRDIDITVPAPPGMIFAVYVKPSGKISRWDWEPADQENPDYPADWRNQRFGRIVWPTVQPI